MAKTVPKKKAANGYKFAEPLPKGEILEDKSKKKWRLGTSIGKGGFGEIYSAQSADTSGSKYPYVIKIEPHANGPLFVEMHFYVRNAKKEDVKNYMRERKLTTFGMPIYLGSGSHEHKGEKYRFLVIEQFGSDIWKFYLENREFPEATVFQIGLQILDVLEYIHSQGYVHADIKGANILMGITKETKTKQVYLVDFGLATKFSTDKEFKPNPKKAHDGTIEYLSRDAHKGVQTRRGDLEILIYNLIQWLGCKLPWEKKLSSPVAVQQSKEECMESVSKMTKACFGSKKVPGAITEYLNYLKTLKFNSEPDYDKLRKILSKGVKDAGGKIGSDLEFKSTSKKPKRKSETLLTSPRVKQKKATENVSEDSDSEKETEVTNEETPKSKPQQKAEPKKRGRKPAAATIAKTTNESNGGMEGYTQAMKEIMQKKLSKANTKKPDKKVAENDFEGYTESMKEIAMKTKKAPKKTKTNIATASRASPRNKRTNLKPVHYDEDSD